MKTNFNLIVAYDLHRGVSKNNKLPWSVPSDLKRFKKLTTHPKQNCVIMGRKTWDSLPAKYRPLPNRINIIISKSLTQLECASGPVYLCSSFDQLESQLPDIVEQYGLESVFIIGGVTIYQQAMERWTIHRLYVTEILDTFDCDLFLPKFDLSNYQLMSSNLLFDHSTSSKLGIRLLSYQDSLNSHLICQATSENSAEQKYLELMIKIMFYGQLRMDRTKVGILSLFGKHLHFDLSQGFPLLTTKKVFFRGVAEELFFFLSGHTNVQTLQEKGVHIWDGNSSRAYLDSIGQQNREVGDLGKFYGFQWRHWGAQYSNCHQDYTGQGFDQIDYVINLIKNKPHSRRILLTAWNPADLQETVLPPCHILYQFYVDSERRQLSCHMYQRSCDFFLGASFNIASTALLVHLLATTCDLKVGKIRISYGDVHLYVNHLQQAEVQIKRTPKAFPQLKIKVKRDRMQDYQWNDLQLINYHPHSALKAPMAV